MNPWMDVFIVALLPLTALFAVVQTQPYFALVSRGIMGVVAVLLYAVMGAPDVALTEALVGTLLTVILYAITVRSTQVVRVGMLAWQKELSPEYPIQRLCSRYRLAIRRIPFMSEQALAAALSEGRIDAVHVEPERLPGFIPNLQGYTSSDQPVTVLAKHGRWHERKLRDLFGDEIPVIRLTLNGTEVCG